MTVAGKLKDWLNSDHRIRHAPTRLQLSDSGRSGSSRPRAAPA